MIQPKRRQRITEWILKAINAANEANTAVDENKLTAECCLVFYCGERLVKEILKHLKIAGKIVFDMDGLYLAKHYKRLNKKGGKNNGNANATAKTSEENLGRY